MKCMVRVEEVMGFVAFLVSDEVVFIFGGEYVIDGVIMVGMMGV